MITNTRIPRSVSVSIVCRACGGAQHVAVAALRLMSAGSCRACGGRIDFAAVAASIPPTLRMEGNAREPARRFSEFP